MAVFLTGLMAGVALVVVVLALYAVGVWRSLRSDM